MQIELTPEEVEVLRKLIEHEVAEINPEIHHTATASLRDELKLYRTALNSLHAKVTGKEPS